MRSFIPLIAAMLVLPAPAARAGEDLATLTKEAKKLTKSYAMALQGTLQKALKEHGPASAIGVCGRQAGPIARIFSRNGWTVGRTALRLRNAMENSPDPWERATLKAFERKIAQGADPEGLIRAEIIADDGGKVFRFMKAIVVEKPCLTCHGENVAQDVLNEISGKYAFDMATGFRVGQLRGAFTLRKALKD